jgi:hypothetical protein
MDLFQLLSAAATCGFPAALAWFLGDAQGAVIDAGQCAITFLDSAVPWSHLAHSVNLPDITPPAVHMPYMPSVDLPDW